MPIQIGPTLYNCSDFTFFPGHARGWARGVRQFVLHIRLLLLLTRGRFGSHASSLARPHKKGNGKKSRIHTRLIRPDGRARYNNSLSAGWTAAARSRAANGTNAWLVPAVPL